MYVRRKNCEYGRIKRSCRKPKPCDSFTNTFGSYLKLLVIWSAILILDFLMEFRFEYMWPCWLLIRTISDSFKYQGITFTIFFTMIALTSDFICYLLVPSSWIFLFGSTCVWMELVWHAERGICVPTVAMCFLFLYVEVAVRLRDPKSLPLSIDLCRPFAAHCIGYPVVTLGFGLKSLLTHQLRLRRQHQVETHNSKYFCLLELALPEEVRTLHRRGELGNGQLAVMGPSNATTGNLAINTTPNTSSAHSLTVTSAITSAPTTSSSTVTTAISSASGTTKSSRKQQQQQQQQNLTNGKSTSVANNCDHSLPSNHTAADRKFFGFDGGDQNHQHQHQPHPNHLGGDAVGCFEGPAVSSSCSSLSGQDLESRTSKKSPSTANSTTSSLPQGHSTPTSAPTNRAKAGDKSSRSGKDTSVYRLEDELRKLRHERESLLLAESSLRSQVAQLTTSERTSRTETNHARQEVEYLQSKLTTLTQRLETERENLQLAERRVAEEQRQRNALETSLASERRARKEAESALKAVAPFGSMSSTIVTTTPSAGNAKAVTKSGVGSVATNRTSDNGGGGGSAATNVSRCTSESCIHRIQELETRLKTLSHEYSKKEARLIAESQSNILKQFQQQHHHQCCDQSHRVADLTLKLRDAEAENARLKATIKSEEKMKQELLAGYHNSLKEITELNSTLTRKEYQIVDLHMRLDMMTPNSPLNILFASDASSGVDVRGGGHSRTSISFLNTTNAICGGGGSLFPPRSTEDFDFGGNSAWPPFPSSTAANSVAFSETPHQQQHRLRSESTSAMLNVLMNAREEKSAIQLLPPPQPPRFDTCAEVDLEAASSSLSPPEFLSKLRSQLALAGSANIQPPQPQPPPQLPAPISPPSRDIVSAISGESDNLSPINPEPLPETDGDVGKDCGSEGGGGSIGGAGGGVGEDLGPGKTGD